ncbi:MAG: hypothetical protein ABIQ47_08320 [Tepidiformaceae bacterium]
MAKYHFAHNYHEALQHVQDVAGGMLVMGPARLGRLRERGHPPPAAQVSWQPRWRGWRDAHAGDEHGERPDDRRLWRLSRGPRVHAEGSLEAEKLMIFRAYNGTRTLDYAKQIVGITE